MPSRPAAATPGASTGPGTERVWRPAWPCPVASVLSIQRLPGGDPTSRVDAHGVHWRGTRTPCGTATLRLESRPSLGEVHATAWGEGAAWVLEQVPGLLGGHDDPTGFEPHHPVVADLLRRRPHWRMSRTGLVVEALVPAVLSQKVTGQEAGLGMRALVHRFGERAPGPGAAAGLWVMPAARTIAAVPSWEWLRMHVDHARSRTLVAACRRAEALERTVGLSGEEVDRRLRSLPGIGRWTSAEVRFRAHGDADAVSFGDYHIAKNVTWALTGVAGDDDDMAALLEPYRPHRYRVQRLVELAGLHRPRRGPRMAPRRHLPHPGPR